MVLLITLVSLLGCASTPYWYRNVPENAFRFYGTGSSDLDSAEKSRKFAVMRAREAIASQVQATMQEVATDYYQENEKASNSQSIAFVEAIVRQVVNVELKYTHIDKVFVSEEGVTYALVYLKTSDLRKAIKEKNDQLKLLAKIDQDNAKAGVDSNDSEAQEIPTQVSDDAQQILQIYMNSLPEGDQE